MGSGAPLQAFVVNETAGTWADAEEVPGVAVLNTGGHAEITSVSCASAGNCAAGGIYWSLDNGDLSVQPFVVNETSGTWGTAPHGHEAAERLSVAVFAQYAGTPSGKVVVTAGKATICVIRLRSGKGSCRLRSRQLKVGTRHLRATYAGSTDFIGSSARKTVIVVR